MEADPELFGIYNLAYELGRTTGSIRAMPVSERAEWSAFFSKKFPPKSDG